MAMNIRHYEQYLSCGYTGKPSFDKYGWIENGKELKENIETVEVFEDKVRDAVGDALDQMEY